MRKTTICALCVRSRKVEPVRAAAAHTALSAHSAVQPSFSRLTEVLLPALATARDFIGCHTVADAFSSPGWLDVLTQTSTLDELKALRLEDLPVSTGPLARLMSALASVTLEVRPRDFETYVSYRVDKSMTLSALGEQRGLSRERVRQIDAQVGNMLEKRAGEHALTIARVMESELLPVFRAEALRSRLDSVLMEAARSRGQTESVVTLAHHLVRSRMKLAVSGQFVLTEEGQSIVRDLSCNLPSVTDDVGLVDLDALLREHAPVALPLLPDLAIVLKLVPLNDRFAVRHTLRARAKAALLEIGRPASKAEIADVAGMNVRALGSTLSGVESIVRADRENWGLTTWVDDVYEGIPTEIARRIQEHGGSVALSVLLEELPRRFGVTASSVRAYVSSKQFRLSGGMVTIAGEHDLSYRAVSDVASRNVDGELCWTFTVTDKHLEGYSITGFPVELARELGCGPNGSCAVPVSDGPEGAAVSVIWRLTTLSGNAEIGRARETLARLGASAGDAMRLVLQLDRSVRFERGAASEFVPPSPVTGQELLERLKRRRRVN